jgi:hypothetical protein
MELLSRRRFSIGSFIPGTKPNLEAKSIIGVRQESVT